MHKFNPSYFNRGMSSISKILAGLVIFAGMAGAAGWIFDIYFLRGIILNASTMRINTAIGFVLSGVYVLHLPSRKILYRLLALVVCLLGFLTLLEHIFDLSLGIDELLFVERDSISEDGKPGRMSPSSAMAFFLSGLIGLFYMLPNPLYKTSQFFSTIIFFIGLAPCMGYLFGESLFGGANIYSQMALPTAIGFVCLGLGLLLSFPEKGYVAVLHGKYMGNAFARIIFVLSTIVPAILSGIFILLNEHGYTASYPTIFLVCMAYALTTILFTYKHLTKINQLDAQRVQLLADVEVSNRELAHTNAELAATVEELSSTNEELTVSNEQLEILNSRLLEANYEIERLSHTAIAASENKYKHLTESISDIFFALDHNLRFIYWNKASEINSGGLTAEQVLGKSLTDLFPGMKGTDPEKCYLEALRTGEFQRCTFESSYSSQTLSYEVSVYPYEDGLTVFIKDITQKKQAETQLRELQSRFESIINSAMDAIITTDEHKNIVLFNQAAENMFGYRAADIIGKPIRQLIPQSLYQPHAQDNGFGYIASSKDDPNKNLYGLRADGNNFPIEASVSDLNLGEKQYSTIIIRDITLRIKAEKQEKQLNNELINQNQQLQQFGYITSHNLRAPIANILGLTQIFNTQDLVDPINQIAIENIRKATIKLDDIIKDLNEILVYQKAINTSREWIRLKDVLNDIKISIAQHIEDSNAQLTTNFSKVEKLYSVKSYINSIFQNMLTNAIKYRKPGVVPKICVSTTLVEEYICLSFSDNGLGIDLEKNKEKIFGMYKRFHVHVEGKGLGLHLVKTQVEALNGKIEVESVLGEGTCFKIFLPYEQLN
jgi:PAS domain S-box-containing protein